MKNNMRPHSLCLFFFSQLVFFFWFCQRIKWNCRYFMYKDMKLLIFSSSRLIDVFVVAVKPAESFSSTHLRNRGRSLLLHGTYNNFYCCRYFVRFFFSVYLKHFIQTLWYSEYWHTYTQQLDCVYKFVFMHVTKGSDVHILLLQGYKKCFKCFQPNKKFKHIILNKNSCIKFRKYYLFLKKIFKI